MTVGARAVLVILLAAAVAVPAALAGPNDPTKRHTAADTKIAKAVALRLSDLGAGWKTAKSSSGSGPDCTVQPDESRLIETADVDPTFEVSGTGVSVDSEVSLFKTKAMALADWRTARLSMLRACLAELLTKSLGKTAKVTAAASVPVRAKAARKLGLHFDFLVNGLATVLLTALGVKGSYRRAALDPLAAVLARRLSASA